MDISRWDAPERDAVDKLISDLDDKDLVILDRLYPSGDLFWRFKQQRIAVLARINSQWKPRIVKTIGVGDFLVEVAVQFPLEQPPAKGNGRPITADVVKVIGYGLNENTTEIVKSAAPKPF